MQTKPQHDPNQGIEKDKREARNVLIGEQVMHTLGRPGSLLRVQVRLLWEKYYRVNVFTGADLASATIAHSYFVQVDNEDNIAQSTPKITKRY
jgi:hypothetical protein